MKILGLMLARNESWILRLSLDAALRWCDEIIFVNHASTDETRLIASTKANETGRVHIYDWTDGEHWLEMDAREMTLDLGRLHGGTHFAIVDADEVLTHNNLAKVRGWFETLNLGACLDLPMIAPWKSLDEYSPHTTASLTLGFRDAPNLAWRPRGVEGYHYHQRCPQGSGNHVQPIKRGSPEGGVFHLQYCDEGRFLAKQHHYAMSELVRWGGKGAEYTAQKINWRYHWWSQEPHGTDLRTVPSEWWGDYKRDLVRLGEPSWYDAEMARLVDKHGDDMFKPLGTFEKMP